MPRKHMKIVNANGKIYLANVSTYQKQPQPVMPEPIFNSGVIFAAVRFYGVATGVYAFDYKIGRGSIESLVNGVSIAVATELGIQVVIPFLADFIRKRVHVREGIPEMLYSLPEEGF